MNHIHHISKALFLVLCLALGACQSETEFSFSGRGGIRVGLENVSSAIVSRSTPAELGTPLADRFSLKVSDAKDVTKYSGPLTNDVIHLQQGTYSVTATCGDNPLLAIDAPYYFGTANVDVVGEEVTEASIACSVGNSLISVVFGRNEEEMARFEKFYQSYALNVKIGDFGVSIPNTATHLSAYFRAGSSPVLVFTGVLREDGAKVEIPLDTTKPGFPSVFNAADHAKVTITLPDPESATVLDISKVEVEEATMEETIPVSWLPVPQATAQHQYDANGDLVGTDITFTNSYPGMEWKAEVKGDDGNVYRTVSGTGALSSDYASNGADWPYLPAGHYTATYYLLQDGKEPMKTGSRDFTVAAPELKITMGGYTSYTKYLEHDIDAANACDNQTVYALSASFNVALPLLNNAHYTHSFTATFDGQAQTTPSARNAVSLSNRTGVAPRSEAYRWSASVSFAGSNITAVREFYVTGLPYKATPPTQSDWSGTANSWRGDYVRLHGNTITKTFYLPADVNVDIDQNVYVRRGTVATTYNLQASSENLCAYEPAYNSSSTFTETFSTILKSSNATVKCVNSYGNADSIVQGTHAKVYSIIVQYR